MVKSIDSKLISVCLINDYSLIADLYVFVYGRAECATISLECTKVKLLILNNFDLILLLMRRCVPLHTVQSEEKISSKKWLN